MGQLLGCAGGIAFLAFGILQLIAAFVGADLYVGGFFAFLIIAGSSAARFTLPITIFAFFGAKNGWEWEWYWAALFAAPGLLLVIPSLFAQILDGVINSVRRH